MPKRLKGPKYDKVIAFLTEIMVDPKVSSNVRMNAAIRLDEMNQRGEKLEEAAIAYKRKVALRALQVANPTLPMPVAEPADDGSSRIQDVLDSVLRPGAANVTEG